MTSTPWRHDLEVTARRNDGGTVNEGDSTSARVTVTPEVLDAAAVAASNPATSGQTDGEMVTSPTKLIRIASMVRTMLDEVRRSPLDDAGRRRLREIHEKSLHELQSVLSPELQKELNDVVLPLSSETPSESELRLAQAQLVGWLEGLFHGIQATLFTQQAMAQSQLEEVRRRSIAAGGAPPGAVPTAAGGDVEPPSGYL